MADDEKRKGRTPSREELRRERELNDIRAVLSTAQGRRFFWRLLGMGRVFALSYDPDTQTGEEKRLDVLFNEGRRSIGNQLWADLHLTGIDNYLTMVKEAQQEEEVRKNGG